MSASFDTGLLPVGFPMPPAAHLDRIVYAYGSQCKALYGWLVLSLDGRVLGYSHPNEHSWRYGDSALTLTTEDNITMSVFRHIGTNAWIGRVLDWQCTSGTKLSRWPLFLLPTLDMTEDTPQGPKSTPTVLVNSVPKSGTYFISQALEAAGCPFAGLHLTDDIKPGYFDFRGLSLQDTKLDPAFARVDLSIDLASYVLRRQHAVAHIHVFEHLQQAMRHAHLTVVNILRDLRSVIRSLYYFKLRQVPPLSPEDSHWRTLSPQESFHGFMNHFATTDIANIRRVAECIIQSPSETHCRYEDLYACTDAAMPESLRRSMSAESFFAALKSVRDLPSATLSPAKDRQPLNWDTKTETLFRKSGLLELNTILGYEQPRNIRGVAKSIFPVAG